MRRIDEWHGQDAVGHSTLLIQRFLFDEWQSFQRPTGERHQIAIAKRSVSRRQCAFGVVMVVESQGDLLDVILALQPSGGFSNALDAGERQTGENRDDGEDDEEFEKCKGRTPIDHSVVLHGLPPLGSRSHKTLFP